MQRIYDSDRDVMLVFDPASGRYIQTTEAGKSGPPQAQVQSYTEPAGRHEMTDAEAVSVSIEGGIAANQLGRSYEDRARAFRIRVSVLALVTAFGASIVALWRYQVPFFSLSLVGWFVTVFTITWLAAYIIDMILSPDTASLLHVLLGWNYLYREQSDRHSRYWSSRR